MAYHSVKLLLARTQSVALINTCLQVIRRQLIKKLLPPISSTIPRNPKDYK